MSENSGTGSIWNIYHDVNIPINTKIKVNILNYTGQLFTAARFICYKEDNTYDVFTPTISSIGDCKIYTALSDYVKIWIQIFRSDVENSVSVTYNVEIYSNNTLLKKVGIIEDDLTELISTNSVIGNYHIYEFKTSQQSGYWNSYIYLNIPKGTRIKMYLIKNKTSELVSSINVRAYNSNNENQVLGVFRNNYGFIENTLTLDAVHIRIQEPVVSPLVNHTITVVLIADNNDGIASELFSVMPKVYNVQKDGSGDFINIVDAIKCATERFDSIVYIGPGTWDILDELGEEYLSTASELNQGIVLKNRIHVICSSKAYIKCIYNGSDPEVIDHISAFNSGPYGFTLENADIEVANIRYCVHDERNAETEHYDNYFINCRMKNTNQTPGSRAQCIGGGLGYDGHIVVDGCIFESPMRTNGGIVTYHNAHGLATDSKSFIEIKNSYFKGTNTFNAYYYGASEVMTTCLVHGNSFGCAPNVLAADTNNSNNINMEIVSWNNEIRV